MRKIETGTAQQVAYPEKKAGNLKRINELRSDIHLIPVIACSPILQMERHPKRRVIRQTRGPRHDLTATKRETKRVGNTLSYRVGQLTLLRAPRVCKRNERQKLR